MTAQKVIEALGLPNEARVDQRVAKKLLIENGAPTASDKKQINEGIEELVWIAALKPNTIGVPEYRDTTKEILEIAVLQVSLRSGAKATRIVELIHRAIPYPTFVVIEGAETVLLSLAMKRWSQNEGGTTVLEEEPLTIGLADDERSESVLQAVSLRKQGRRNLKKFYEGWKSSMEAYLASAYTGSFAPAISEEAAEKRRKALEEASAIQRELIALKAQAERETQMNRRVSLNLEIKRLEQKLTQAIEAMRY